MAGCGGGSSSSSGEPDVVVTPEPSPEPTPEPIVDPQPETLVFTGEDDDADLSEADLDVVAAEIIKLTYGRGLVETVQPYLAEMQFLEEELLGEDGGYYFQDYSRRSTSALDLDLETVGQNTMSGSETRAGQCGGTAELSYESSVEQRYGEDSEVGAAWETLLTQDSNANFSEDYCVYDSFGDNENATVFTGTAEFAGNVSFYNDSDSTEGGYDYGSFEVNAELIVDVTVSAEGLTGRYQQNKTNSGLEYADNRTDPSVYAGNGEQVDNKRLTINGQIVESSEIHLSSYDSESEIESYTNDEILAYDGSVFLIHQLRGVSLEGGYLDLGLEASYTGYGVIFTDAQDLTFCADGSGFNTGTIEFWDAFSTAATITFNGCGVAPTVALAPTEF